MKARGEISPVTAFTLEPIPKKPGKSLVRFYENAKVYEETGYEWDEYHLEMPSYPGLENDVEANYDMLISQAKLVEEQNNAESMLRAEQAQTRADIEYIAMMMEVDL